MIDLDDEDYCELLTILKRHLKNCRLYAFGSRVTGNNQRFSDVDLCIMDDDPIPLGVLDDLREALSESSLPVSVDIMDIHAISEEFKEVIERADKILMPIHE
ncbi:MAG: nucleotidyltransferase domain-containing protein [Methanobacteriota archaeon]